jgi:hypothetical protein
LRGTPSSRSARNLTGHHTGLGFDKQEILFRLARAALEHADKTLRDALYPVVGGEVLRHLVAEANADAHFRARVRTRPALVVLAPLAAEGLLRELEQRTSTSSG